MAGCHKPSAKQGGLTGERAACHVRGPRLALTIGEACEALGCSHEWRLEHVAPKVRMVRRGRKKLVPVAELERWLEANAERLFEVRR